MRDEETPPEEKGLKGNAEATASFFSRITFSWLTGLLVTGKARALEHTDLFMLQTRDATKRNYELLLRAWEVEAAKPSHYPNANPKPKPNPNPNPNPNPDPNPIPNPNPNQVEAAGPRKSYLRAWHVAFGRYFWVSY